MIQLMMILFQLMWYIHNEQNRIRGTKQRRKTMKTYCLHTRTRIVHTLAACVDFVRTDSAPARAQRQHVYHLHSGCVIYSRLSFEIFRIQISIHVRV